MNPELSPAQRRVYEFITQQVQDSGMPPTVREIARRFSLAIGTVQDHLAALDRKGVVKRLKDRARGLAVAVRKDVTALRLPLLGRVPAGGPLEAIGHAEDFLPVSEEISRGASFVLKAKGDSMVPKIEEGDLLLVRPQETAEDGDIVIAQFEDTNEATVKRFRRDGKQNHLEAINPRYGPLRGRFKIVGKVTGLIRPRLR